MWCHRHVLADVAEQRIQVAHRKLAQSGLHRQENPLGTAEMCCACLITTELTCDAIHECIHECIQMPIMSAIHDCIQELFMNEVMNAFRSNKL